MRAVTIQPLDSHEYWVVIGRHDIPAGTFVPVAAVEGCWVEGDPVEAADGAVWAFVRSFDRVTPEILRLDPSGGFQLMQWPLAVRWSLPATS